jgi:hypothetical protein
LKKKKDDEQVLRLLMCALTCFDDALTETTRGEEEEKSLAHYSPISVASVRMVEHRHLQKKEN